jgi:hypothetical protein
MFPFLCSSGGVGAITGLTITDVGTGAVDLTARGGADYHIFNSAEALNAGDRKSGGSSTITVVEYDPSSAYTSDTEGKSRAISATDAVPTSSVSRSTVWRLFNAVALPEGGVSISLPAGTGLRNASIYVMAYHAASTAPRFQAVATLSDGSASPQTTNYSVPVAGNDYYLRIDVTYNAANAGQTLDVVWKFVGEVASTVRTVQYIASWVSL